MSDFRIEDGVLIRYQGFSNKINIPEGVEKIATSAFFDCKAFGISIPKTVLEIEDLAFPNCSHLISIQVDEDNPNYKSENNILIDKRTNTVILVPQDKTGSVTLPSYIERIKSKAFANCANLSIINLPENLKRIGEAAFINCKSLINITIPDNIEKIPDLAFYNCKALSSVTLPKNLKEIGYSSFSDCISLKEIVIPEGVYKVDCKAFSKCRELETVTIPETLTDLHKYAFYQCSSLDNIKLNKNNKRYTLDEGVLIDNKTSNIVLIAMNKEGEVVVPEGSTSIHKRLFKDHKGITSIIIPNSVKKIGDKAFWNCENLKNLVLPSSLTTLKGTKAKDFNSNSRGFLYGCNSLPTLVLPEGMKEIGEYAFVNCYGLYNVKFPSTLEVIGESSFEGCRNLSEAIIPENVKVIGESAFYDCRSISYVEIPKGIEEIQKWAFSGCTDLVNFNLKNKEMEVRGEWFGAKMSAYSNFYRPVVYERIRSGIKSFFPNQLSYDFIDNIVTKVISILGNKEDVEEEWKTAWLDYLRLSRNHYYLEFAKNTAFMELILDMDFLLMEDVKDILALSTEYSLVEVTALLLDYQNEKFTFEDMMKYQEEELSEDFIPAYITREDWDYIELDDGTLMITNYIGGDYDVTVPSKIGHSRVSIIGEKALSSINKNISEDQKFVREKLRSITIPEGIEKIGKNCFTFCPSLKTITIPESVKEIEKCNYDALSQNLCIKGVKGSFAEQYVMLINSNTDGEIKFEEL